MSSKKRVCVIEHTVVYIHIYMYAIVEKEMKANKKEFKDNKEKEKRQWGKENT